MKWMATTLKKLFNMIIQKFWNHLRILNHLIELFPHTDNDKIFTETDLKIIFLKAMPIAGQQGYILKGTQTLDTFKEMMAYSTNYQAFIDPCNATSTLAQQMLQVAFQLKF